MEHNPAQPFIWSWKPRNATRFSKYGRHRTENTLFTDFSSVFCGRLANRPHMLVHDGHSSFWSSKHPQLVADSNSSSIHSAMLCIVIHKISTALPTQPTGHILREAARGMRERQIGKQVENCTLASKKWGVLEALLQMTPIPAAFVCSKACDIVAEDAFSVASQHSSVLFLPSAGSTWQELKEPYSWISQLRFEHLKTVTVYFWTLQKTKLPCFLEPFSSFLHVWPWWHHASYFHARRGQICEFPTCSQWEVPACLYIP